jgi:hypothetical protein
MMATFANTKLYGSIPFFMLKVFLCKIFAAKIQKFTDKIVRPGGAVTILPATVRTSVLCLLLLLTSCFGREEAWVERLFPRLQCGIATFAKEESLYGRADFLLKYRMGGTASRRGCIT